MMDETFAEFRAREEKRRAAYRREQAEALYRAQGMDALLADFDEQRERSNSNAEWRGGAFGWIVACIILFFNPHYGAPEMLRIGVMAVILWFILRAAWRGVVRLSGREES